MQSRDCTAELESWCKRKAEELGSAAAGVPGSLCGPHIVTSFTGGLRIPPTSPSDGIAGPAHLGELPSLRVSDALPSRLPLNLFSSPLPHASPSPPYGLHIWLMTIQSG